MRGHHRFACFTATLFAGWLLFAGAVSAQDISAEAYAAAKATRRAASEQMAERISAAIASGSLVDKQLGAALRERGVAYNYLGDYPKALEDFSRAIELDLLNPQYYEDRAILYLKLRDYAAADNDLDMALGLDTKRAASLREKGRAAAYRGDFDRAASEFSLALKNAKGEAVVYGTLWMYIALARAGRPETGTLQQVSSQINPGQWPFPLFLMYLGEISPQAAIEAAASPIANDDLMRKCEAWFYVGEKYLIDGDVDRAREAFQAAVATDVTQFLEHDWAARELERLNESKPAVTKEPPAELNQSEPSPPDQQ